METLKDFLGIVIPVVLALIGGLVALGRSFRQINVNKERMDRFELRMDKLEEKVRRVDADFHARADALSSEMSTTREEMARLGGLLENCLPDQSVLAIQKLTEELKQQRSNAP